MGREGIIYIFGWIETSPIKPNDLYFSHARNTRMCSTYKVVDKIPRMVSY